MAHGTKSPSNTPAPRQRASAVTPPTTTLEVERKFAPTSRSTQLLANNSGAKPFRSLVFLGSTQFEDVYYDTPDDDLSRAGIWLRRRGDGGSDQRWEAKVRVGGDYTNSAFEELTDVAQISALLGGLLGPGAGLDAGAEAPRGGGLREAARFVSYRSKFLVDGRFTVMLDATDFGHVVGEVELEREIGGSGAEEACDRTRVIQEMDKEIDHFMKSHLWAFPAGKPVGKLSAYFALKKHD